MDCGVYELLPYTTDYIREVHPDKLYWARFESSFLAVPLQNSNNKNIYIKKILPTAKKKSHDLLSPKPSHCKNFKERGKYN
jgi:hypothetical protein